jgi:hypothetical protein
MDRLVVSVGPARLGPRDRRPRARCPVSVDWTEDVTLRWLPRLLAPVAAWFGALGFKLGMRRLNRMLAQTN